jgi:HKD family nuclease
MLIIQPAKEARLGDFLCRNLMDERWKEFLCAVAFAKRSGIRHLTSALRAFSERGCARVVVGVDLGGTSREGLADLLACLDDRGEVWVYHNEAASTFHPKVYFFRNPRQGLVVVGSGNLTEGGLFTNCEASLTRSLDLGNEEDRRVMADVDRAFASWLDAASGTCRRLTPAFLDELCASGYVLEEARAAGEEKAEGETASRETRRAASALFGRVNPPRPPALPRVVRARIEHVRTTGSTSPTRTTTHRTFVMTLQRTDVGVGQTTSGTSRRSPEVFIPLRARDAEPAFWGWPDQFTEDARRAGKFDRTGVPMEINGESVRVNMMTWPAKHDFRLRNEALRSAGVVGDILKIMKVSGHAEAAYRVEVVRRGTPEFDDHLARCTGKAPNSKKRWGYF